MIERLKMCWFVLTKKHYALFAYDELKYNNTKAICYIDRESQECKIFLESISEYVTILKNKNERLTNN